MARRRRVSLPAPRSLPLPHPYKILFKSRHLTRTSWLNNPNPKRLHFLAHGSHVVTCLLFSRGRIISASDDNSIHVYSPVTGQLIRSLEGHQGGVWALAATKDTLVSGSTDRTVRIWDLKTGNCTHVFGGHTSTVRCLAIVKPEIVEVTGEDGITRRERWPKRPLIVTGSRDHTLRVWTLPKPGEEEYRYYGADDNDGDPSEVCYSLLKWLCGLLTLYRIFRKTSRIIRTTSCYWRGMTMQYGRWLHEVVLLFLAVTTAQSEFGIS